MNRYKTLVSNTLLISVGTFGSKLLVFLMVRFYTAYLTPADYGVADILMQTANLMIPLVSLGIADGVFRYTIDSAGDRQNDTATDSSSLAPGRQTASSDAGSQPPGRQTASSDAGSQPTAQRATSKGDRRSVFTAGIYTVTAGCLLSLAAIPLLNMIPYIHNQAWLIVAFTAASCYHSVCSQFVRAEGNTMLYAVQGFINTALVVALNILFLAGMNLGITGYILSVVLADLATTAFLIVRDRLWRQLTLKPCRDLWSRILRYSIPLIPATAFWWITNVSDRYIISSILGSEHTGFYTVAYKIPTVLIILSSIFMDAWHFSAISESVGSETENAHFYSSVWSTFQVAMFLCGSVTIAFAQIEVRLLASSAYYSAWTYIPVLSMAMVFTAFTSFMGSVYVVKAKSRLSLRTAMFGAIINIILNLVLIPSPLGVQGAAIATFAAYFTVFVIRAVNVRKYIPFSLDIRNLIMGTLVLSVQTTFMVLQLPKWQLIQALAIPVILFMGYKPLVTGIRKALPARLVRRHR